MRDIADFSDEDFRLTILRALRLMLVLGVPAALLVGWKLGWQNALLLVVGTVISGSGLWEWLRLMTGVMRAMDGGGKARTGRLLAMFFLRLLLVGGILYVSLKYLDGSIYALAGGLVLGVFCLSMEGIRAMKAWTV